MLFIQSLKWFFCFWYVVIKMSSFLTILMNAHFFWDQIVESILFLEHFLDVLCFLEEKKLFVCWFVVSSDDQIRWNQLVQSVAIWNCAKSTIFFPMYVHFWLQGFDRYSAREFFWLEIIFLAQTFDPPLSKRRPHLPLYIVINCTFELKIIFVNNFFLVYIFIKKDPLICSQNLSSRFSKEKA